MPDAAPASEIPANLDESIEEVRFYLGQGMTEQAEQILEKLETIAPDAPELSLLRRGIDAAKQHRRSAASESPIAIEESGIVAPPAIVEDAVTAPAPTHFAQTQPWPSERPVFETPTPELEPTLGENPDPAPAPVRPAAPPIAAQANARFAPGTLDEFVADLEASLGSDFIVEGAPAEVPVPAAPQPPAPPAANKAPQVVTQSETQTARAAVASVSHGHPVEHAPAPPPIHASVPAPVRTPTPTSHVPPSTPAAPPPQRFDPASSVDLSSLFGELKQELEHDAASADEDPETHYNLGVAFREMGLLDEAIGELQKVCQFVDRGHTFPNLMQAYTWLAQCFLEKGMPEVAVRWYEKALKLPNLDQETRTALHYELASALESAGNNPAALTNFLEVYSSNIDYRDVGERIKALRP